MSTKEDHDRALERWSRYEHECYLANTADMILLPPSMPPTNYPTIVYPRDKLLEFRAAYVLLRNAVADLLDLDPDTMTQIQIIVAIAKKHWAKREAMSRHEP